MDDARVPIITSTFISLAVLTSLSVVCRSITIKSSHAAAMWLGHAISALLQLRFGVQARAGLAIAGACGALFDL